MLSFDIFLLAFIYMHGDDETLFRIGFIAAPIYIIVLFMVNLGEYIPWQDSSYLR